jgi:feruloyl esterase
MPSEGWDGRLHGVGIGGFAGSIDYMTLGTAVKAGQAGAATDTGHTGTMIDSAWANGHPELVRDHGWRAIHLTTVAAKKLVAAFYGRGPDRSYFVGCSGGGRQGLMEASRFPDDYDGVLAGAPAAVWTDLTMSMINQIQAQLPAGAAIRSEQAHLIQDEVIKQCDALDGQTDGLVDDPRQCKLDSSKLACGASNSPQCLSSPQLTALARIFAGPHDASGRQLTGGYLPSGSEAGVPWPTMGWEGYILTGSSGRPQGELLVGGLLKDLVQQPFATPATFDFNKDPARLRTALAADLDAKPDLRPFFKRGGKLILWHGWADAAIPPEATLKFHDAILRSSGPKANDSVRLFMVPGVQHCFGGTGPNMFGQIGAPPPGDTPDRNMVAALQAWVEGDKAPETLVGRRGLGGFMGLPAPKPERQRLLCAYPKKSVLKPGADPDQASSYGCQL